MNFRWVGFVGEVRLGPNTVDEMEMDVTILGEFHMYMICIYTCIIWILAMGLWRLSKILVPPMTIEDTSKYMIQFTVGFPPRG